ncbi:nuclear apoptosis-inducing factor 1 isoform X3 [Microcaecilia unicolor]|uniref:Nuclear apoptosis-inducing factor 1-like isoform X3 n=1 Tax=Microcaecilia unicolor TaxID=1415580 RepID=A0A6P7WQE9_9AMPH|nr:nuclear apoptosis-inducing factor 1-like isoform X3 [Microcaecilia unicolor]
MSQGGSVQMIHQRNSGHASQPAQSLQAVPPYMMKYMRPKEAKRKPNFTRAEVMVLAQEVELRQEVLFGSGPIFFKLAAWQEVVTAVNAVGHMNRSLEECKKRHRDLKRRCKEKMAAAERNRNAAGGGPVVQPIMTPAEQIAGQTMPSCMLQGVCSIDTAMPTVLSAGSSLVASSKLEADGLRQSWGLHETEQSLERSGSPSGASTSGHPFPMKYKCLTPVPYWPKLIFPESITQNHRILLHPNLQCLVLVA